MDYQISNVRELQPSFRAYDSAEVEKRGEQPLHEAVQHCMEHIPAVIRDINSLTIEELDELAEITQKIEDWSLAKIKFYDASWIGFLKRIFSCCRNAWSFGVFRSSGEQGLFIAAMLREEIRKRREDDNLEPSEELKAKVEKILKSTERELFKAYRGFNMEEFSSDKEEIAHEIGIKPQLTKVEPPVKTTTFAKPEPVRQKQKPVVNRVPDTSPFKVTPKKLDFDSPAKDSHVAQASPRARSFSYTETPPPKMFVSESPSWQVNRVAKQAVTQMPESFPSTLDEVLYRVEHKIYEKGKVFDLLNRLLKEGKLQEFLEKLGSGKLLNAYWECESSEFITSDTNRVNRIERLKVIFSCLSEEQLETSMKQGHFFTIIGNATMHYAKVAVEVFSAQQLEKIASQCDSEPRLTALSGILTDMSPLADLIEAKSADPNPKPEETIEREVNSERYGKIEAIITGIGKLSSVVKKNEKCQIAFANIQDLIPRRAPRKTANPFLEKLKQAMGL